MTPKTKSHEISKNLAIVIGAQKAGTTSMYGYLKRHPQICVTRFKECNFFLKDERYHHGYDWYEQLFENPAEVYADVSPNYSKVASDKVARRLHEYAPNARIIYLLRHPVERMISHYMHKLSHGRVSRPLHKMIYQKGFEHHDLVYPGRYAYHLQNLLHYFDRQQLKLIDFRQLAGQRMEVLNEIFAFLGISAEVEDSMFDFVSHESSKKKRPSAVDRYIAHPRINRVAKKLLPARWSQPRNIPKPELALDDRRHILDVYRGDMEYLEQFGFDCSGWTE